MPVTLRRHLATKKVNGKRVVPLSGLKEGMRAGGVLRSRMGAFDWPAAQTRGRIKSYSTEAERGILGAKTAQRAFGLKKGKVNLRKELSFAKFFIDEKKAMDILMTKYKGDEVAARNAWLKGDTFEGTLHPPTKIAEDIIRRRLGLALATEAGKAGFGKKPIPIKNLLMDNVTHSWIIESVVQRLTKGIHDAPQMEGLPKESTGLRIFFVPQQNGKLKVQMNYEGFTGNVTKNFKECVLPSVRKYLDA